MAMGQQNYVYKWQCGNKTMFINGNVATKPCLSMAMGKQNHFRKWQCNNTPMFINGNEPTQPRLKMSQSHPF